MSDLQNSVADESYIEPTSFITNDTVKLDTLFNLLKSGKYKELIGEDFFPEILNMGDNVFIQSSRLVRTDIIHKYEWYFTFDKNVNLIDEYKSSGYLQLFPGYTLVRLSGETKAPNSVILDAIFKLSNDKYYKKYSDPTTKVEVVETEMPESVNTDNKPAFLYVPKPVAAEVSVEDLRKLEVGEKIPDIPLLRSVGILLNDIREGKIIHPEMDRFRPSNEWSTFH